MFFPLFARMSQSDACMSLVDRMARSNARISLLGPTVPSAHGEQVDKMLKAGVPSDFRFIDPYGKCRFFYSPDAIASPGDVEVANLADLLTKLRQDCGDEILHSKHDF